MVVATRYAAGASTAGDRGLARVLNSRLATLLALFSPATMPTRSSSRPSAPAMPVAGRFTIGAQSERPASPWTDFAPER